MRKPFNIVVAILVIASAGLLFFIFPKKSEVVRNHTKEYPTTTAIIQILNNIDPPFANTDSIFLETGMKLCGDTPDGFEIPIPPQQEDLPLIEKLHAWAYSKIQNKNEFESIMDTVVIYSVRNSKNIVDSKQRNKIYVLVDLRQSNRENELYVYENYLYADTFRQVVKRFTIDQNLQAYTKQGN